MERDLLTCRKESGVANAVKKLLESAASCLRFQRPSCGGGGGGGQPLSELACLVSSREIRPWR